MARKMDVVITDEKLQRLALGAHRMTGYADPEGSLLIARLNAADGTPVRLILDKSCIRGKDAEFDDSS